MEQNTKNKKRFRDYGLTAGFLPIGPKNSISDVAGVRVGHLTKIEGERIRTGVTLIDPGIAELYWKKIPAAIAVGNGSGKLTGLSQVQELGTLEAPIALTNTTGVGGAFRGLVNLILSREKLGPTDTVNAVVAETNDWFLNDIHLDSILPKDVLAAAENLTVDFETGSVGAGTGMRAFSWKGGIGTASRKIKIAAGEFAVGALVQTNYGGSLEILGVPVGRLLGKNDFGDFLPAGHGSCIFVISTDAPLSARQLERIAKRALLALPRTGAIMATRSGDYAIAFTTNRAMLEGAATGPGISDNDLNSFFLAAMEASEEGIYDAIFSAEEIIGRDGNVWPILPKEKVAEILKQRLR